MNEVTPAGDGQHLRLRVQRPRRPGLRRRRQPLRRQLRHQHGERGDARGDVSTFASGFNGPDGLAFDAAGNLYVANQCNGTVSEVTPAGVVSTFASGFNQPCGLAFDAAGNLYVANGGGNTVIEVSVDRGGAVHAGRHRRGRHRLQRRQPQPLIFPAGQTTAEHHRHAALRPRRQPRR